MFLHIELLMLFSRWVRKNVVSTIRILSRIKKMQEYHNICPEVIEIWFSNEEDLTSFWRWCLNKTNVVKSATNLWVGYRGIHIEFQLLFRISFCFYEWSLDFAFFVCNFFMNYLEYLSTYSNSPRISS